MHKHRVFPDPTFLIFALLFVTSILLVFLCWNIIHSNIFAALVAGFGLAFAMIVCGAWLFSPTDRRSQATERTLRIASSTLAHMTDGLSEQGCMSVCQLLLGETSAAAIAMTNTRTTLAYVGKQPGASLVGTPVADGVLSVIKSKRMQTFTLADQREWRDEQQCFVEGARGAYPFHAGIIAPLVVKDECIGTLKLYFSHQRDMDHTQLAIVRGFAELLSTQLSAYELDRQAELTARAEVKALQAQINPHFLFNTLNTIASFTRTNPDRARSLLRDFSSFYRHTLESSQTLIPLSEELAQTRRYLQIERARFGDDRICETEHIHPACIDMLVPGFIIQPIVENAVRHALPDTGVLNIDIQAVIDGRDVLLSVTDDGLGMEQEVVASLLAKDTTTQTSSKHGTGIALKNVAARVERFYGVGSGVEIVSKLEEGTCVSLRLVGEAHSS